MGHRALVTSLRRQSRARAGALYAGQRAPSAPNLGQTIFLVLSLILKISDTDESSNTEEITTVIDNQVSSIKDCEVPDLDLQIIDDD